MSVLFFFIDGLGIGEKNKHNPVYKEKLWQHFIKTSHLTLPAHRSQGKTYCLIPTDARMDTPGIPQSATGQTALFTGLNAAKIIGAHITGFPGEELSAMISEHSILKQLKDMGLNVSSANAYSKQYFDLVEQKKRRISASTHTIKAANIPFKMLDDLKNQKAVFMDITHTLLKQRYPEMPLISSRRAAFSMGNLLREYDFVLYEYFWTDYLGHKGNKKEKSFHLHILNAFLKKLVHTLDLKKHTIIISSDHGNIEDATSLGHSMNPVPTIIFSKRKNILRYFLQNVHDLPSVAKTIINGFRDSLFER